MFSSDCKRSAGNSYDLVILKQYLVLYSFFCVSTSVSLSLLFVFFPICFIPLFISVHSAFVFADRFLLNMYICLTLFLSFHFLFTNIVPSSACPFLFSLSIFPLSGIWLYLCLCHNVKFLILTSFELTGKGNVNSSFANNNCKDIMGLLLMAGSYFTSLIAFELCGFTDQQNCCGSGITRRPNLAKITDFWSLASLSYYC